MKIQANKTTSSTGGTAKKLTPRVNALAKKTNASAKKAVKKYYGTSGSNMEIMPKKKKPGIREIGQR